MPGPRLSSALLALAMALVCVAGTAHADDFVAVDPGSLSFKVDKPRTRESRILMASLAGGALLFGGIGALFHLDSKHKSDDVSASGSHTGLTYTAEVDDVRRAALRSRNLAIVSYGLGGGLLIATLVAYIVTDPGTETITLGTERQVSLPILVAPTADGVVVGKAWSF